MRRPDYSDIPEAFRRAFEGEDWQPQEGDGGEGDGPPGPDGGPTGPRPDPWWQNRNIWVIGGLLVLFLSFDWLINTYTDWLWFIERGYSSVWLTQLTARLAAFALFFTIAAVVLLTSWHTARRTAAKTATPFFSGQSLLNLPGLNWLTTAFALFLAFTFGTAGASQWELFLLYFNRVPFALDDPIFGQDIGFYVFELPVYNFIQGWFMPLLVFSMMGVTGFYVVRFLPALQNGKFTVQDIPTSLRRSIAVLGAVFFALWAWGYQLDTYSLLFSPRGVVFGAGYTDVNASLYALYIQIASALVLSLTLAYNYFRFELRPLAISALLWLGAVILVGGIYPGLLQRFVVEPTELQREGPYIQHNIDFTRRAFDLHDVDERDFGQVDVLEQQDLDDNDAALDNVRLWDYRPLLQTYSQLQELRPYYQFGEVDVDRYEIDGQQRQVMLSARELNKTSLPNNTWVNQKLEFTHGYGVVMNPVDRFTQQGRPEFFISDLPPTSTVDIPLTRPEIYYGEMTTDMVFAGSDLREFNYPDENNNVYTSYDGPGGVPLGGQLRQLAFAFRFGETNMLFSEYITPETRAMFYRQIQERVRQITPFFMLDNDPYLVIHDGRLVWIQDAYTVSGNYPYSQPVVIGGNQRLNYIRNSVKITIDAYDGDVIYYMADEEDPIVQAYDATFPGLFRPLAEMPAGLQEHIRYPEDLFRIQTNQYLTYHMTDVQVFYNKEDLREIPQEIFDGQTQLMEPYYVMFRLPGEEETEYLLIQPYTPAGKRNMIAWIAARNDPENYGELVAYNLPKQSLVVGPIQIEGFIDQEPDISQQLSLWDQRGSRVIRGNLIVIPLNDSFLYVEPIYLESDTSALPELKRVIVASGERIVMRDNLSDALEALLSDELDVAIIEVDDLEPVGEGSPDETADPTPTPGETDQEPIAAPTGTTQELITQANQQFTAAEEAQRNGDWTEYGRQIEALQATLTELERLTQE